MLIWFPLELQSAFDHIDVIICALEILSIIIIVKRRPIVHPAVAAWTEVYLSIIFLDNVRICEVSVAVVDVIA